MAGLEWHGDRVLALIEAAAAEGVGDGIDLIADESQNRVPYQTRELMNSQQTRKRGLQAVTGYTDSKAAAAHENLAVNLRHGRRAKFLESAARDKREDVVRAVAEKIRRVL